MPDDISRLRVEYADRARRLAGSDIYSVFNQANLFAIQYRQRAVLDALRAHGFTNLSSLRILEMGCGSGGVLSEFQWLGALPERLFGVDLLPARLNEARSLLPVSHFLNANGQNLPFPDSTFDMVLQYTAISSILDEGLRRAICADMLRVTRPGGLILSYDFWLNPTNPHTRGLKPPEIRRLFPGCAISFKRVTLAPPLARRLAGFLWTVCAFLEALQVFNTHYLAAIRRPGLLD